MILKVQILTPEWNKEVEADALFLPGSCCPFEVLPMHAPIISSLDQGIVRWRLDGKEESIHIKGGVVRVEREQIHICAEI